jgi:hypothetical protein
MALIPLMDGYDLLDMDAKTVRTALKRAGIVPSPHPTDARIKCLTTEQIERLAAQHARVLRPILPGQPGSAATGEPTRAVGGSAPAPEPDRALLQRLATLESRLAQLCEHLSDLAWLLLKLRDGAGDERRQALSPSVPPPAAAPLRAEETQTPEAGASASKPARRLIAAQEPARSRMPPLIEYSRQGTYVIVSSQQGELSLPPDSREWFDWLATLPSFRFVGPCGRLTAQRKSARGQRTRSWWPIVPFTASNSRTILASLSA